MTRRWKAKSLSGVLAVCLCLISGSAFAGDAPASVSGVVYRHAKVVTAKGPVEYKKDPSTNEWQPVQQGELLYKGATIRTGKNGAADLALSGKNEGEEAATLSLRSESEMTLDELDTEKTTGAEKTKLAMAIGKVLIKAKELKGDSSFEVKTPTSVVGVWGTEFEVDVKKEEIKARK